MDALYNADVISMPDKWEYPWYAAWDLAFHCVPLALVDSEFGAVPMLNRSSRTSAANTGRMFRRTHDSSKALRHPEIS